MQYTKIDKFKNFAIQHRMIVVILLCALILGTLASVFQNGYSARLEHEEFSEIQELVAIIKDKDKDIYSGVEYKEIRRTAKGIDVSAHQGNIDWEKVKATGIDFVMIRCGFRYKEQGTIEEDKNFKYNISEAIKNNIPVGVYFYSTAINEREVLEEASFVLNLIKDYRITYPVVYDFEIFGQNRARNTNKRVINNNALIFLNYIRNHGYNGMLYTNLRGIEKYWDLDKFKDYKIWYAQYIEESAYAKDYAIWQYSDTGRVDGITGYVDLNESYVTYEIIEE